MARKNLNVAIRDSGDGEGLLRKLRVSRGLSLNALAQMVGYSASRLREFECNEDVGQIQLSKLAQIVEGQGYTLEYRIKKTKPDEDDLGECLERHVDGKAFLLGERKRSAPRQARRSLELVRRSVGFKNTIARFQPRGCYARLFGHEYQLTPTGYLVLAELALAYPGGATEQQLMAAGWDKADAAGTSHLSVLLTHIRQRLRQKPVGIDIRGTKQGTYFLIPPHGWEGEPPDLPSRKKT